MQCNAIQLQYNTIRYGTTQYNTIRYDTIQYNTIRYNTIQYDTIRYDTIRYNTIQYNTTLFYYAGHTQQKLVSRWGVGKHVTIKYICPFKRKSILHGISTIQWKAWKARRQVFVWNPRVIVPSLPHRKACSRVLHHYTLSYASENLCMALEVLDYFRCF